MLKKSMDSYEAHKVARDKREKHIAGDIEGLLDKTPMILKSGTKKLFAVKQASEEAERRKRRRRKAKRLLGAGGCVGQGVAACP